MSKTNGQVIGWGEYKDSICKAASGNPNKGKAACPRAQGVFELLAQIKARVSLAEYQAAVNAAMDALNKKASEFLTIETARMEKASQIDTKEAPRKAGLRWRAINASHSEFNKVIEGYARSLDQSADGSPAGNTIPL